MNKLLIAALALSLLAGTEADAQSFVGADRISHDAPEDANRRADGTYDRGSYLTNAWYDNWSFSIQGGLQTLMAEGNNGLDMTPSFDINATKWVTPTVAVRFGMNGVNLEERRPDGRFTDHYRPKYEDGQFKYDMSYLHIDAMLSLTNLLWGYKETRFVNATPYFHAGYLRLSHPDYNYFVPKNDNGEFMRDREVALGFGLLTSIRITNCWSATIDIRDLNLSARYHDMKVGGRANIPQVMIGAAYTIQKWYWERRSTNVAPLQEDVQEAREALQKAEKLNDNLDVQNQELTQEVETLKQEVIKRPVITDELIRRIQNAELVLYYDINVNTLSSTESLRLEKYVTETLENEPDHVFYITGSADKGTGNFKINTYLSTSRAAGVKRTLIRKYGIPDSQIVIKATIISEEHEDGRLDRCVLLENE